MISITYAPLKETYPKLKRVSPGDMIDASKYKKGDPSPTLCKPWIDANSFGLLMRFPYNCTLTVKMLDDGVLDINYIGEYAPCSSFGEGHYGIACGYKIKTQPAGIGLYVIPVNDMLPKRAAPAVRGFVETWWYPRPMFIVFNKPAKGQSHIFMRGTPMCLAIPICIREKFELERMNGQDEANFDRLQEQYDADRHHTLWRANTGSLFSHEYRQQSAREHRPG